MLSPTKVRTLVPVLRAPNGLTCERQTLVPPEAASGTSPCGPARRSRSPYLGVKRRGQSRDRDGRGLSVPHAC